MSDLIAQFAQQHGFSVAIDNDIIRAVGVPCLVANGNVGTCTIEKSFDTESGRPDGRIGSGAVHVVRIFPSVDHAQDGCVYNANGSKIGNYIDGDGSTWSEISIKRGSPHEPLEDHSAKDLILRYAKHIVGAVHAAQYYKPMFLTVDTPFNIPNTFEARSGVGTVQDRIRNHRLAIVGLGGTGSYILDLIAKTPVIEIHLFDDDHGTWHNYIRAPGAPTREEIDAHPTSTPYKVDYYQKKYSSLRNGIHPHTTRVGLSPDFTEFLSNNPVDFAFVCIDQLTNEESSRQDGVYTALTEARVPFIDSGVSLTINDQDSTIGGSITTSVYSAGSSKWKDAIPNAKVFGEKVGYRNVQLPEVNALAASLAVIEWRRFTKQFTTESSSFFHKFRLEHPRLVSGNTL